MIHGGALAADLRKGAELVAIGSCGSQMQAKLLRALQEGEFQRVGSPETVRVDVRIVAATNRDLPAEIADAAVAELECLGSQDQQAELLGQWGGIATISGESYLVGQPAGV